MNHFELQTAITNTVTLATGTVANSPIAGDLREHLGSLLACQIMRAIEPHSEPMASVLLSADPQPRVTFADTVFDPERSIEWTRRPVSTERLNFASAEKACAECRTSGHSDWRLPTRDELQSLVDYTRYNPAIDTDLFLDTPVSYFWSSSPAASAPDYAWLVYFDDGDVYVLPRVSRAFVRAVRSVPPRQ